MRIPTTAAIAASLVLALTACGGPSADPQNSADAGMATQTDSSSPTSDTSTAASQGAYTGSFTFINGNTAFGGGIVESTWDCAQPYAASACGRVLAAQQGPGDSSIVPGVPGGKEGCSGQVDYGTINGVAINLSTGCDLTSVAAGGQPRPPSAPPKLVTTPPVQ